MTRKRITVTGFANRDPHQLFARGPNEGEFFFISPPKEGSPAYDYFAEIYAGVKAGRQIGLAAETEGMTATFIVPSNLELKIRKPAALAEGVAGESTLSSATGQDIFREHQVVLSYHNAPRRAILMEPWNGAGHLIYLSLIMHRYDEDPIFKYKADPGFKRLVLSWDWVFDADSRWVFGECVRRGPEEKEERYDYVKMKALEAEVMKERIDQVCSTAVDRAVDLVLMGLFTEDNACSWGGGIGDLCDMNESGIPVVNQLRSRGYKGEIVALKAMPYCIADTPMNRSAYSNLFNCGVKISPSNKVETLQQILVGGSFVSDYSLDGTPEEIEAKRTGSGLLGSVTVNPRFRPD